jgi:hypothetical protein
MKRIAPKLYISHFGLVGFAIIKHSTQRRSKAARRDAVSHERSVIRTD